MSSNEQKINEFELNFFGSSKYWTIHEKVNQNVTVRFVKALYKAEAGVTGDINSFYLMSKSKRLSDNSTIGEYGIRDQRHLLNVRFYPQQQKLNDFAMIVNYYFDRHEKNNEKWKQNYSDLKSKLNSKYDALYDRFKNLNRWIVSNTDYRRWHSDIITNWIIQINLDNEFDRGIPGKLRKQLREEHITGNDLISLTKNDFKRFGLEHDDYKNLVDCILQEIRKLTQRKNENDQLKQEMKRLQDKYDKRLNKLQNDNSILKQELSSKDTNNKYEYNLLLTKNASLEEVNIDLKQKNDSFRQRNTELTIENKSLVNRYNTMSKEKEHASKALIQKNSDLNEECKELKLELKDIKDKYNKWIQQNSDYTTWDYNIITDWIIGLDEQFIQYEHELRKQLQQEEITGADLKDLDKNDLKGFGIRVFKHKTRIIQEIQNLVMQKQNNNMQNDNNIIAYNEGKKK
eukprot:376361_1